MEVWKKIDGYENYSISNLGNVRNDSNGKILKGFVMWKGYRCSDLNGKRLRISRLVGLAFIPNPYNYNQIDHIDRNKLNDNVNNLRWVSNRDNMINRNIQSNNTSGYKGITYEKNIKRWRARIAKIQIGMFDTKEEAYEARVKYCRDNNIIS